MKAMILAAGEGRRMRPLTEATPKPLLQVGGLALIERHLIALKQGGFEEVVVNAAYLSSQLVDFCGDGSQWGLRLQMSVESVPLETAGGIINALPHLADAPFAVINGDIWCDYPLDRLKATELGEASAHLVLVRNPPQHPTGDFSLDSRGLVQAAVDSATFTFSGIAIYHPRLFQGLEAGVRPLKPVLDTAISAGQVSGEVWAGQWEDVGTPERLALLKEKLAAER